MSPIEPRHDFRQAAMAMFEAYTAYLDAGFNTEQALRITIAHATAGTNEGDSA